MSIRSALQMTEPTLAFSNATNIEPRIKQDGDHYVINGMKWCTSALGDLRCWIAIAMSKKIDMTRRRCLNAADMMDRASDRSARREIAMMKVAAPLIVVRNLDDAIQVRGGWGVSHGYRPKHDWAMMRTLRLTDGPEEVHNYSITRSEFGRCAAKDVHHVRSSDLEASR